jgi:hypothetical protein
MHFVHDQVSNGRSIRLFDVTDDVNREGLDIEVDFLCRASESSDRWSASWNGAAGWIGFGAITAPSKSV